MHFPPQLMLSYFTYQLIMTAGSPKLVHTRDGQILNFCQITDMGHLVYNILPDPDFCRIGFFYSYSETKVAHSTNTPSRQPQLAISYLYSTEMVLIWIY